MLKAYHNLLKVFQVSGRAFGNPLLAFLEIKTSAYSQKNKNAYLHIFDLFGEVCEAYHHIYKAFVEGYMACPDAFEVSVEV